MKLIKAVPLKYDKTVFRGEFVGIENTNGFKWASFHLYIYCDTQSDCVKWLAYGAASDYLEFKLKAVDTAYQLSFRKTLGLSKYVLEIYMNSSVIGEIKLRLCESLTKQIGEINE